MRLRYKICLFLSLTLSPSGVLSQTNSPDALRSAARMLTLGELSGVAERAGQGDVDSQVLMALSLRLVAGRMEYDPQGRAGTLGLSAHWLRLAAEKTPLQPSTSWRPRIYSF